MPGQTKYFISNTNGFFINWYSDITGVESHGQALKASGNSGDDAVYVGQGTKVDATGLTSTGGNDSIYLTGTFNNYEQTLDGNTYTFKRTVNINGTEYQEEVSFTASNGDRVYFANGFVKIDITGNDGLLNLNTGAFKRIESTDIDNSKSTPGLGIGLSITDDKSDTAKVGEVITYTFTFDEAVTDFDINDITVTGGTKGTFTSVNGSESVYTLELTPPANSKGIISLTVAVDAATSKVNTALKSAAASNNQSFDTQAPTLIISDDKADALTLKTGDTITYTFTFSEAVTGFDKSVINISNGAIKTGTDLIASTTPADAGKVYTLTVVPSSDLDVGSNLTVSVSANTAITDSAGNAYSTTAANNEQAIDTKAPVAALSGNMAPNENLTMTFLEAVTINTAGSIVIYDKANPSTLITIDIANQVSLDSTNKIITINPGSDLIVNKNYYVKIDAGTFEDTAGNDYEGIDSDSGWGFLVYSFTTTAQWVDASGNSVSDNGINASEFSTLAIQGTLTNSSGAAGVVISAITFKAASGATANDRVVETSNLPTFASANGTEWTLANSKIPALVSGETYTIEINLSSTGGGTSTGGNTTPVLIDTAAPIITGWAVNSPTDGQSGFKVDDVIELTMTTNEALSLSNATSSKVTIGNKEFTLDTGKGAAKAGASVDELKQLFFTYTVKVDDSINKADFEITNVSAIALTGVTDVAGNIVATTVTYPIELDRNVDGVVPTIGDITLNWGDVLNAIEDNSNGTVTVATTGVENNQEVSLVINQKTYTGTVTNNSATITVTATDLQALTHGQTYSYKVNIKDTAGNPAIEKIGDFKVDTVAPTVTITDNEDATAEALSTTIAWIGADDNYINDSEKDATALSGKVTGIGTLTITKIEFFEGSNTVGTAITSGLPAVAADGTWALTHSAMPSELADGKTYTAVVTLSDGTNSAISTSTAVTYDTINPTPITTNPWTLSNIPAGQSAFKAGDIISLTLTMSETLKLNNTTGSKVVIAGKDFVLDKTASTTAGDKKLVFKYSVQAGDSIAATDFDIDNPTSDITLNNITDVAGNAPVFTADRVVLAKTKFEYIEKIGLGNNPFEGIDVGDLSPPTLADIDGDGDLDLVMGEFYGTLKYYQNTGTTSNPAYEVKTGNSNPFDGIDVGRYSAPILVDIDGDGDLDLVVGEIYGTLKYYQNTGTTSNPTYEAKTGGSNPFNGIDVGYYSKPTLADIDGDGDLDLVVGEKYGTLKYYQNTGTTSNPAYEAKTGDSNPFDGIDVGYRSKPTLADIDGDGDLDLVVGEKNGTLKYYQNTGTTSNPAYEAKTGDDNPFNGIDVGDSSSPTLADIDGDGDLDLVVGNGGGTFKYYYNQQSFFVDGQAPTPTATNSWTLSNIPAGQSAFKVGDVISLTLTMSETLKLNNTTGSKVVIAGKDFVLDKTASTTAGDKKLVFKYSVQAGDSIAATDFYIDNPTRDITLNNITNVAGNAPVFTADRVVLAKTKFEYIEKTGSGNNPFEGIDVGDLSPPTLADIDGDGDLDLVMGEFYGTLKYYQNTGTTSNPAYEVKTGNSNPFDGIDVGRYSAPILVDIDGDGDLDLVVGEIYGTLKYYQNTGTTSNPTYEAKTGGSNPFNGIDVGYYSKPTLADIDGDGDLDLVVGEKYGTLKYYQNTGTTSNPAYEAKTGDSNPFDGIDVGYRSKPTLADIDGDGDLDLVVGENNGTLKYYQNTGTTSNPAYEAKTGDDNPFNGIDVGDSSSPTLADIDGDGDLDLVVGKYDGTLKYYYNQQPSSVDGQAPTPTATNSWTLSNIPAGQSAFKTGDVISLTLTMSETLKLNNTTGSKVVIAGKDFVLDKTTSITAGDKKLVFKYSVQAGDSIAATDFDIDNPTSDITLNNITDVAGNAPVFTADRVVLTKLEYIEKTGSGNNPFNGIDVGKFSAPTLADIDGDGDLDLVVGKNDGLKYYQNTSSTSNPAYEVKTGDSNPFNGIDVGYSSKPTLADIDGDGDLDLVVGEYNGTLKYYQNTGTTSNPAYEAKTGDDNPFNGINAGYSSSPTLADIDGDGDLDLVMGEGNGTLKYYQNTGTTSNPAYEAKTGGSNPFNGIDVGDFATPTLADIDGDGDLDLVVGERYGTLKYYQNIGTTSNPAYEVKTGDSNPFDGIDVGIYSAPTLADIDGDGDLDLVVGEFGGTLKYYYNQQPSSVDGQAPTLTTQASVILEETSDLVLDFSENIKAGTGSILIKNSSDVTVATINIASDTNKFSITNDKLTIDVSALGLTNNKLTVGSYYLEMNSGAITDMVGNDALGIAKNSNQWAFKTIVLTTDIVWAGADDNYINNNEKDATTLSGTVAGAGTLSITKIEFFEGSNSVATVSSLPTIADDKTWTLAHANMPSELADGKTYTAVVTLSDGTNSTISTSTAVTYDTINPTPTATNSWTLSNIPAGQSAFKTGDVISLTLTMSETLKLNNTTGSKVVIAGKDFVLDKTASTTAGDKKLVFKYSVQAGDSIAATDFDIDNPTSDITLNNITDVAGNAPVFTTDRVVLSKIEYIEKIGSGNNPFEGIDVGYYSTPTLADIDGDGDLDLVVGEINGTLKYYQNTGTTSNPAYTAKTDNPFNGINTGYYSSPTLADIDGDGDLDLVVGEINGTLKYYQNTGTTSNPAYEVKTGNSNPFDGIDVGIYSGPTLADIDGDGDLDLVMGESAGTLKYYQNTGTTSNPAYEAKTGDDNPFNGIDVGYSSKPTLADIDGDGDLDLVVGEQNGTLKYYQNTGTTSNPAYEVKTGGNNPFNGIDVGGYSSPTLADIDGDGDLDLVVGKDDGTLKYYYNQQPASVDGQAPTPTATNSWTLSNIPAGQSAFKTGDVISLTLTMSETLKLNNTTGSKVVIAGKDFVLDKTASTTAGDKKLVFKYSVQAGDSIAATDFDIDNPTSDITLNNITDVAGNAPVFTADRVVLTKTKLGYIEKTGLGNNPFNGIDVGDFSKPTLADIDGDGDLDLVVGEGAGTLKYYQNTGTTSNPAYEAKTGGNNPFNGIDVGYSSSPTLADIDGDGDLDLVVGESNGTLKYYQNTGTTSNPAYTAKTGGSNPFNGIDAGDSPSPTLADIDGDGDLDLVMGEAYGTLKYYQNTGTTSNPAYEVKTGGSNPFNSIDVGDFSAPTLADIDGDGDLDLVVGKDDGTLKYYQNTGTTSNPTYEAKTGDDNPFNGIDVGRYSAPVLADIDGDGDLDLMVGESDGTLKYYYNQQPSSVDGQAPTLTTQASVILEETSDLVLDFSENIKAGTGSILIKNSSDVTVATINIASDTTKFSIAGDKLTIDVSALGLTDNKLTQGSYYITMDAGTVTDIAGNDAAAITKDTNQWVFATKALFTTIAWIGADDNYINDSEKDATALSGTVAGAGTLSITKIEFFEGSNTVGTAITSGLPAVAADGTWTLAHSAMPSELADGKTYTAVVTLSDGTNSAISTSTAVTYDIINPTPITTNPWTLSDIPAGQSAFKAGDVISLTLTMSETLKLNNTTGSKVVIAGKDFVLDKTASITAGDKKLVFKYSVQAGDSIAVTDFDIDNPTSDITLNNITDVAGNAPVFTADRVVLSKLEYIEKIGSGNNPFNGIDVGGCSTPILADIDGDGDLDLVVGEFDGTLKYYQNTGTTSNPAYEAKTGGDNPFNGIDVGYYSTPTLADIDGDGDLDLVVGESDGTLKYYQNTSSTSNPAYEAKTGDDNPFNGIDVGDSSKPALADIDGDGDLDLVVGEYYGTLKYYQNTGTTSNPAYEVKTGDSNPFNGIDVGSYSTPILADIDGDGDLDLVVGKYDGILKYYQNTGTTSNPAYEAKTGDDNPFNGIDVGYYSAPTLADIDGDGDLDLVVGEVYGTLKYYYNQQPASVDGQAQRPLSVDEQVPTFTEKTSDTNVLGEPSNLVIEFSENIKTNGGIVEIWNSAEKVATISITNANISDTTLTLNPSSLTSGVYYIKMASGVITDTSGNDFAGIDNTSGKTWAFAYNFYIGTDNADTITGSAGDDTINGGAGNDTINGCEGSDIFVYANTDNGEDTITGFIFGAGGDKLDLKDFITASGNQATLFANIDKYITVSDTGTAGSAKLTIDADGTVTDDVADLVINLQGVSGIGGSSTPDTVALGHFITDNLILV
uniref:FG-GAP-like repeat-containing protein n=1 Tax=Candidatus Thiodubiliella endoseptemdiera TaxID=2738886 RepID=UPI0034E04E55